MADLDIAVAATIGTRAEQQDAAGVAPIGAGNAATLLMLADGLGGHADGAAAARIVVDTFDEAAKGNRFADPDSYRDVLDDVVQEINRRVGAATDPADGQRGMGSTAVAAIIDAGTARWISVGDSHLYVCRKGRLSKLNADHSQAAAMIRDGYSPRDEAVLKAQSVLVSAITGREIEEIDNPAHNVALEPGDVVLLASDGLNTLSVAEIARTIELNSTLGAERTAAALIENIQAKNFRRQDNATVVVARVLGIAGDEGVGGAQVVSTTITLPHPRNSARLDGSDPRRGGLQVLAALITAALAASVIVTQTNCCGWP